MELTLIIAGTALFAALIAWLLTHFISRARFDRRLYAKDAQLASKEAELRAAQSLREHESAVYARTLEELKASQQRALEATKNELALENEKLLKAREESLRKEAEDTMRTLTGGLDKDIKEMKEAFDAQRKAHAEESSSIKTQFEQTVRHLKEQTDAISTQAGDLASALKGQNKMQGIFGETILENLLQAEGLRAGRDYETEFWLRDKAGNIIHNELTDKKMRPDFALHYPDSTDVILDAKVSLTALSDYFSADSDAARADAARRNLQSVLSHVAELAGKEYQKHIVGRKTLDYVIMFIPNYGAWQLAKQEDPEIFTKALAQNVLITTEETLLPFLRLIRSAWVQKEQMENMSQIVAGAQKMLDRVALFSEKNAEVENSLRQTLRKMEENSKRLVEGRQSIARAAQEVLECGVSPSPGKSLPEAQ
ncbi:MAG: DNA recombination protein RmuC [Bacteroidales bacterium]|nr:DNA recombination protein RmuC [Bacteroidales bacterium]